MADEVVVIVEPPPPEIMVVVEPPLPEVQVVLSEVGLVGPSGELNSDQLAIVANTASEIVTTELEPEVDLTLLFENAIT